MTTLPISRRDIIQAGAAVGVALTTAGVAAAQTAPVAQAAAPNLPNPLDRYSRPPFKPQNQQFPGLAAEMDPPPDHGERSYRGSGRLVGRKALVTGGDSGMGRAAVIAFAREGADVAIGYLPAEERDAQDVKRLVEAEGRKCLLLPGDIKDEQFCGKLVTDAVSGLDGLDILVNNAAHQVFFSRDIAELTTEQFDATFKTNVYAMFWISKAAIPHLPAGGSIINTTSSLAFRPSPAQLDYTQTKSAIVAFTKALAGQLIGKGIRVNAVAPGIVWTPLLVTADLPPESFATIGENSPYKRPGQPAEMASIYVLLASGDSTYTTGEVYPGAGGESPF